MTSNIRELILEEEAMMIEIRRFLHKYPEASFREIETTNYIMEKLEQLDIPHQALLPTGVVAEIQGEHPGKTVALRADIDGLEVEEKNDVPYKSKVKAMMHASGHDTHTAMLLTAAKVLSQMKEDIYGTVKLIFQPGEVVLGGAKQFIDQGILDDVDNIFGLHIWSGAPSKTVSCPTGPYFASADSFSVEFIGESGHAAQPQRAVDATIMMTHYINDIQTIVSRNTRSTTPVVITVGKAVSGSHFNIISGQSFMEGTVRTFDNEIRDFVRRRLEQMAGAVADMHGGQGTFDYQKITDPLVNDAGSSQLVKDIVHAHFGEEAYHEMVPTTISDDFSFYLNEVPGAYATIGSCSSQETSHSHHSDHFDIDESAMATGAELHVRYALEYLKQNE